MHQHSPVGADMGFHEELRAYSYLKQTPHGPEQDVTECKQSIITAEASFFRHGTSKFSLAHRDRKFLCSVTLSAGSPAWAKPLLCARSCE